MTDAEIMKALECCTNDADEPNCKECPKRPHIYCMCELLEEAFDLIKRQQARFDKIVEELQKDEKRWRESGTEFKDATELGIAQGLRLAIKIVKGVQKNDID